MKPEYQTRNIFPDTRLISAEAQRLKKCVYRELWSQILSLPDDPEQLLSATLAAYNYLFSLLGTGACEPLLDLDAGVRQKAGLPETLRAVCEAACPQEAKALSIRQVCHPQDASLTENKTELFDFLRTNLATANTVIVYKGYARYYVVIGYDLTSLNPPEAYLPLNLIEK